MIKLIEKRPLVTIALFTMAVLLPNLTALEVGIMEARNFISAREMLTEGNWILTTLNGEARYAKPPLPTWITAIFGAFLGIDNVWGLRLPGALMLMFLGIGVFTLSRKLSLSKTHSLYNGLIVVTSAFVVLVVFDAPWDIYAFTFMLWSIYYMVRWLQKDTTLGVALGIILFLAAAILSKGPVALYVLLLPFLMAYGISFGIAKSQKQAFTVLGFIGIGVALGFCWYIYVKYVDPIHFNRMTNKETTNWSSYNVRPFYYYWNFFLQSGVWTLPAFLSLLYPYMRSRVNDLKVYQLSLLWTLLAVILLSVIPEKKSRYLMPVLIPLAINCGFYIEYIIREFRQTATWKEKVPVYVQFGLIGIVFISFLVGLYLYPLFGEIPWYGYALFVFPMGIGVILLRSLFVFKNIRHVFYLTFVGMVITGFVISPIAQGQITNGNYRPFSEIDLPPDLPVYGYEMAIPELIWAYGDRLPSLDESDLVSVKIPSEFVVLECGICDYMIEEEFVGYTLKLLDTVNLNKIAPGKKYYKYRKTARVFLAKKR